jgi:hypothetical protein
MLKTLTKIAVAAVLAIGGASGALAASAKHKANHKANKHITQQYRAGYQAYGAVPSNNYYARQEQWHRHDLKGW